MMRRFKSKIIKKKKRTRDKLNKLRDEKVEQAENKVNQFTEQEQEFMMLKADEWYNIYQNEMTNAMNEAFPDMPKHILEEKIMKKEIKIRNNYLSDKDFYCNVELFLDDEIIKTFTVQMEVTNEQVPSGD